MDESVLEQRSYFMMLGLPFSSKLDWSSYIISIAKTASKKIGALIPSMEFLSPEDALYLYKSQLKSSSFSIGTITIIGIISNDFTSLILREFYL